MENVKISRMEEKDRKAMIVFICLDAIKIDI